MDQKNFNIDDFRKHIDHNLHDDKRKKEAAVLKQALEREIEEINAPPCTCDEGDCDYCSVFAEEKPDLAERLQEIEIQISKIDRILNIQSYTTT